MAESLGADAADKEPLLLIRQQFLGPVRKSTIDEKLLLPLGVDEMYLKADFPVVPAPRLPLREILDCHGRMLFANASGDFTQGVAPDIAEIREPNARGPYSESAVVQSLKET